MKRTYFGLFLVGVLIFGGALAFGYLEKRNRLEEFVRGGLYVAYPGRPDEALLRDVETDIQKQPALKDLASQERWAERLGALREEYARLRTLVTRGEELDSALRNKLVPGTEMSAQAEELHEITLELRADTPAFRTAVQTLGKEIKAAAFYVEERPKLLAQARQTAQSLDSLFVPNLDPLVSRAVVLFPDHKLTLDSELARLKAVRQNMRTRLGELEAAAALPAREFDVEKFRDLATLIEAVHTNTRLSLDEFRRNLRDLDVSISHVLLDAEERGAEPSKESYEFLQIVRVAADGSMQTEQVWRKVTEAEFDRDIDHLGMTIFHKPRGQLYAPPQGARPPEPAGPAGYEYVGEDSFGEWVETGDADADASWRFRRRALGLAGLLGGAVLRSQWKAYRKARDGGRSYYGQGKARHGTRALLTTPRFKASKLASHYFKHKARRSRSRSSSGSSYRGRSSSGYRGTSGRSYGK